MKLNYFSGSTLPSSYANAVHVMKMCNAFAAIDSLDVTLFGKTGTQTEDLYKFYDVPKSFTVKRSPTVKIPGLSGLIRIAYTLMNKGKPDIIYGRDMWTLALSTLSKTPLIIELHEIPGSKLQKFALNAILKSKNLKGIVVITQGLKEDLCTYAPYLNSNNILIAHDGADLPVGMTPKAELKKLTGTTLQIGYGGSLYKGKGVELLYDIAKMAPDIGVHIFGGPQSELEKWKKKDIPSNMHFYGHMSQEPLKEHLNACDILTAPYQEKIHINTGADISRWISPLKLFEYMAMQKPIICSDLPVLREVMENERNCLLATSNSPEEWIKAIKSLESDPNKGKTIAKNAYSDLKEQYNWQKRAKNIQKRYFPVNAL